MTIAQFSYENCAIQKKPSRVEGILRVGRVYNTPIQLICCWPYMVRNKIGFNLVLISSDYYTYQ